MNKKLAKKLVAAHRRKYPKIAEAARGISICDNAFAQQINPNIFPRSKAVFKAVLDQERERAASAAYQRGSDDQKRFGIESLEKQAQQARIDAIKEVTELAKQMSKMAYMLMMTLNDGKPFNGG